MVSSLICIMRADVQGLHADVSSDNPEAASSSVQAKGAARDIGKGANPGSSNLPSPGAAADKAAGNAKGLAKDAKQAGKNLASDLSDLPNPFDKGLQNPFDGPGGLADQVHSHSVLCIPAHCCHQASKFRIWQHLCCHRTWAA